MTLQRNVASLPSKSLAAANGLVVFVDDADVEDWFKQKKGTLLRKGNK